MKAYICDKCGNTISKLGIFPEGALTVAFSPTPTISNIRAVHATLCPECASKFAEWIGADDLMEDSKI